MTNTGPSLKPMQYQLWFNHAKRHSDIQHKHRTVLKAYPCQHSVTSIRNH